MANPLSNPPVLGVKLAILSGALASSASVANACVDASGLYAYLLIKWAATVTVNASGSQSLPASTITVASSPITANFNTVGYFRVTSDAGIQVVLYTGRTATTFTGCSGGTGTIADGAAITPVGQILQVKLSNMTTQDPWWARPPGPAYLALAYDDTNSKIVSLMSDGTIWTTPVVAGTPPTSGTPAQANAAITNVSAGNVGPNTGGLIRDAAAGYIWQVSKQVKPVFGFAYGHATLADYTAVSHNVEPGQAIGNSYPACYGIASYDAGDRFAFAMAADTNGAVYNIVGRWRQDQGRIEVLADGNGMCNSSGNGATPGQAVSNVLALAYGTSGADDGKLFCLSSTRRLYTIGTDELTVTDLGVLSGVDAHNVTAPLYWLPTGGYTGGGATAGQLFVSTINAVQIYY